MTVDERLVEFFIDTIQQKEREVKELRDALQRADWDKERMSKEVAVLDKAVNDLKNENKTLRVKLDELTA